MEIELKFDGEFRNAFQSGNKSCTIRGSKKAEKGDWFNVFGKEYVITHVESCTYAGAISLWDFDGFPSQVEAIETINRFYGEASDRIFWIHWFRERGNGFENANYFASHLFETYSRLVNTIRYSTLPKICHEDVASHSFFVSYITMLICDYLIKDADSEKAIRMALVHDVEESLTGDIIYTIKHHDRDFFDAVTMLNERIIEEIYQDNESYISLWKENKEQKTIEAKIVEVADRISTLVYLSNEINLGSKVAKELYFRVIGLLRSYNIPELEHTINKFEEKWLE